jgi:hypothetical protein
MRLKIKGLPEFDIYAARTSLRQLKGRCTLLYYFPFSRLNVEEISDQFRSYIVILRDNYSNRTLIIEHLKQLPKSSFDSTISQNLNKCRKFFYEIVIVYPTVTGERDLIL